jgi:2-desacetyl-2-hydroxyethyl bacteriochlorophyllide A dehydrogenase
MKALCYYGKEDIRYQDFEDPTLETDTDVIVKMDQCGICGSDLHIYHGQGFSPDVGFCVGHEAIGTVEDVGRAVRLVTKGDPVMISAAVGCGSCPACLAGEIVKCHVAGFACYGLGAALQGCQAEAIRVPMGDFNVRHIPDGVTPEQALMLTDNLPTAHLACQRADIVPGSDVAVVGLGPIGLMAVEIASVMGAARVFALDLVPERRATAEKLGAIPVDPADATESIFEATKGRMVDSVVECVGADASLGLSLQLAGVRGTISSIGVNQSMDFQFPMALAMARGLTFRIALCSVQSHWDELIALVRAGRLRPEQFISHRMSLAEGAEAYRLFDAKEDGALKMVFTA